MLINATIVGLPAVSSAGSRFYELATWNESRDFTGTISRSDFDKGSVIEVVQPSEEIKFSVQSSVQASKTETKGIDQSGNVDLGVESQTEVGGSVGEGIVVQGKQAVKVSAKGSYGVKVSGQSVAKVDDGYVETVSFTGRKLGAPAPTISMK